MHTSGLYQIIPRSKVAFSVRQYTPPSCLIWQSYHAELAFKTNRHYSLIVGDERPQSKEYIMAESAVSLSCYCFIYYIIELSHKNSNYLHPDRFPSVWEHVRPEWSSPTTAVSPFSTSHVWINEERINWIEVWVSEFASTKLLICQLHKSFACSLSNADNVRLSAPKAQFMKGCMYQKWCHHVSDACKLCC